MVAKKTSLRPAQRTSFGATKNRHSMCLPKGRVGKHVSLRLAQRTGFGATKNRRSLSLPKGRVGKHVSLRLCSADGLWHSKKELPLPEPVEGACWQTRVASTGSANGFGVAVGHGAVLAHHFLANQYKGMGGFFQNNPTPPCSPFSWRASDNERERRAKGR